MPARLRLSWGMKTLKLFLLSVLESLEFGWQTIRYALIFVSAFFRQRASLGCEMVAMRSQLTFYKESIRQKRQPRPRFHPAFRLLWVLLSSTAHPLPLGWLYEPVIRPISPHFTGMAIRSSSEATARSRRSRRSSLHLVFSSPN